MSSKHTDFKVDYHQLGTSEDVEDWAYTTVLKNILDDDETLVKCQGSSTPKKEPNEIIKDFVQMVPNGKVLCISKATYRSKLYYIVVDNKDYKTFLSFSYSKRDKIKDSDFHLATNNKDLSIEFEKYVKENFTNEKKNNVYVISQGSSGLTLQNMGALEQLLERGNYTDEILESYDYVVDQFNKKDPYGRLSIFNGPPGTGKTYLLRSLVGKIQNCLIVLLPSKLVSEIDSPALITLLSEEKAEYGTMNREGEDKANLPILFIIEDADACLVPRESDNVLTISSLLNYTDGILGSMLDLRIVATTNQERIQFDEALMRPGRLCKHVYVGPLDPSKASEVYARVSGKEKVYDKDTSLAQVYADVHGTTVTPNKKKKSMGFT